MFLSVNSESVDTSGFAWFDEVELAGRMQPLAIDENRIRANNLIVNSLDSAICVRLIILPPYLYIVT